MKRILISQGLITLLGCLLIGFFNAKHGAYSFLAGSGLVFLSVFLLGIGWGLIFQKKLIALAIGIIVFKYAILGVIIFTVVKLSWFMPLWFVMGVASFMFSAIYFAVTEALKEGNDNVI